MIMLNMPIRLAIAVTCRWANSEATTKEWSEQQYRNIKRGIKMTSKLFYKSILSKTIPIILALYFLLNGLYLKFVDEIMPLNVYIGLTISIVLLVEIIISFFRTLRVLHKYQVKDEKRAKLYLKYIPYFPTLFTTLLFSFLLTMDKSPNYRCLIVYISAIIATINFLFSIILNLKLNIFSIIFEEEK